MLDMSPEAALVDVAIAMAVLVAMFMSISVDYGVVLQSVNICSGVI